MSKATRALPRTRALPGTGHGRGSRSSFSTRCLECQKLHASPEVPVRPALSIPHEMCRTSGAPRSRETVPHNDHLPQGRDWAHSALHPHLPPVPGQRGGSHCLRGFSSKHKKAPQFTKKRIGLFHSAGNTAKCPKPHVLRPWLTDRMSLTLGKMDSYWRLETSSPPGMPAVALVWTSGAKGRLVHDLRGRPQVSSKAGLEVWISGSTRSRHKHRLMLPAPPVPPASFILAVPTRSSHISERRSRVSRVSRVLLLAPLCLVLVRRLLLGTCL